MTESEFVEELRLVVGDKAKEWSIKELYGYIAFYLIAQNEMRLKRENNNPAQQDRGLEELFLNFGTTETVLAAFLVQLLARYSKDIVVELLDFFKHQQESGQNEQEKVSDQN